MPFVKNIDGAMSVAPNFVYNKNYELVKENKDQYLYPVDGWVWVDTEEEGYAVLGLEPPTEEPAEPTP